LNPQTLDLEVSMLPQDQTDDYEQKNKNKSG
jgi:hypothetical protein